MTTVTSILDLDFDYFNLVQYPAERLRSLLSWADHPVALVVEDPRPGGRGPLRRQVGPAHRHRPRGRRGCPEVKELWQVERLFRSVKSILATRPIFHKCDETIRGHVFCSFLALVLLRRGVSARCERWPNIL